MPAKFYDEDLYYSIAENNMDSLSNAVFFLGVRIHVIHVWCRLTAMEYAARLGHFQQVKLLWQELERYSNLIDLGKRAVRVLKEAVRHGRYNDRTFLRQLIQQYHHDCALAIPEMVEYWACDLLELFADETCIPIIIKECINAGSKRLFQLPERIKNHPVYVHEIQKMTEKDRLEVAAMRGNTAEVSRLFAETKPQFASVQHTVKVRGVTERHCRVPKFIETMVQTNDEDFLRQLLDSPTFNLLVKLTKMESMDLLDAMLQTGLEGEFVQSVEVIVSHSDFDKSQIEWHPLYYDLLKAGKLRSAAAIKRLRPRLKQEAKDRLFRSYGHRTLLREMKDDVPVNVIVDLVEEIDALPRKSPSYGGNWKKGLKYYFMSCGRPDLVEPLRDAGFYISYLVSGVLTHLRWFSCDSLDDKVREWDANRIKSGIIKDLRAKTLAKVYLSEDGPTRSPMIELTAVAYASDSERVILRQCVVQTGKKLGVIESTSDVYEKEKLDGARKFISEIQAQQVSSISLQKLCRRSMRQRIRQANPQNSLTDRILSLYHNEHLPMTEVSYLLYRDQNLPYPLYYRLVEPLFRFSRSRVHGYTHKMPSDSDSDGYWEQGTDRSTSD